MGGGASKQLKDDAPAPSVRPPKQKKEGKKEEVKEKDDVGKARKRIAAVESKVMQGNRTRVDEDVSDDEAAAGAYDSDLERELEEDMEALRRQEPEDEHRVLAIQDKARSEALQWTTLVLPPSDFQPAENSEFRPDEELSLDFVHGYRGWDCLNNVFYTVTDEILYFAGTVGLVLEPVSRRQKQYVGPPSKRVSQICSLAMHPGGSIVATAERALNPTIYIWDLSTLATVRELTDAHQGGVSAMSFSKDGKRLVTAGMGQGHVVAVWEWKNDKKNSPLCTQSLKTPKIFAVGYNPRDDVIVACGVSMIEFLRVGLSRTGQRVLEHLPGVFAVSNRATHDISPSMLCVAFTKTEFSLTSELQNAVEGLCLTGSDIGNIYLWKREEQIDMIVAAHKGSVYALSTFVNGFASGGKDGKVRMWNNDLDPLRTYDISAAAMAEIVVKAVDQKQGVVLIGTASSEILQLDQDSGEVVTVTRGHKEGGVYAVATHPTKALYASVGNDAVLRLWDLANKREWKRKQVEGPGRSVAFSPDGKLIAVGHHLGSWSIHRLDNMDEIASGKDRKKAIWAIKFSPNLRFMAVGSEDAFIDLYDCVNDYDWLGALQGHTGAVRELDWSEDSRLLQSCGSDQDLLYWNVQDQTLISGFEATRNTSWDTWTSTVGWPVQGLVGSGLQTESCCRSLSSHMIATANSDSLIRLYRYPCVVSGAEENLSGGHVGPAHCVRFSFDDGYLITCAESDRCVFQWLVSSEAAIGFDALDPDALATLQIGDVALGDKKKDGFEQQRLNKRQERLELEAVPMMDPGKEIPQKDQKQRGKEAVKGSGAEDEGVDPRKGRKAPDQPGVPENLPDVEEEVEETEVVADSDIERELKVTYNRGPVTEKVEEKNEEMPEPGEPLFTLKSQTMSVAPTKYKKPDDADDQPNGGLQMEFIYGFRAHDTRNGAQYTGLGEIVMIAGATAVVYSPIQHSQRFFNGHTDDVICQALHPDMVTVATGQVGKKALLCVWDTRTMQTLSQMRGFHDHGICAVGFNGKGNLLVSVGMDGDHSIALWNWQKGAKVASATGHSRRIFSVAFNPSDDSIITCGIQHVKFWTVTGRLLRGKTGDFSTGGGTKEQAFLSLTVSKKGRIFTGSEQGEIYRWKNMAVDSMVLAHEGPVFALWVCRDGLCSGGKDGKVSIWSLSLNHLVDFDMRSQSVGLERTRIRSVCWLVRTVLVGTVDAELFEIDIEAGLPTLLLQGHRAGPVPALVCHPSKRTFVTGGADWTVRVWDMEVRKQLNLRTMECPVCAVAISLDGNQVTVGLENGKFVVLNLRSMRPILERKDRKKAINELKYSTNGKFLAVGSDDCYVDLYDVLDKYEWIGTCQGHMSGVLAVDWSTDSKQLHSDDRGKNHMFWDVESTKEILVAAEVRDVEWSTWTSTMGWPALGIAPKFSGPVGINSACRSAFGDTLATGDDWGTIKLFRFPCITPGARCKRYGGHSSRVGKIRFSFEEKTMVSTGLVDGLVIQWRYMSAGKLLEAEEVPSDDEEEMEMEVRGAINEAKEDSDVERELSTKFGRGDSQMTMDKAGIMTVKSHRMVIGKEVVVEDGQQSQLNVQSISNEGEGDAMALAGKREWRKPMDADEAPYNCLQLEHVYGYRGHDCRNNLVYNEEGLLVYMVGAVGVVYRKEEHMQFFYSAHTDDIISLAIHPDRHTIATGQVGKSPMVHLWSSQTMQTLTTLRGFHELGIAALGFNKDGSKLASVGLDLDHSIAVWDWKSQTKLATAPGSTEKIFDIRFNPVDDVLVTCGVRHIKFWTLVGDNQLKAKRGVYGQEGVQQTMLCNAFTDAGLALTGAQSGDIFLWKGSHLEWQFEAAHKGPVFALSTYPDGFVSGGKDGRVRLWSGLDPVKVFDFSSTAVATTVPTRIRSACWRDGKVLVGTMSNEIFEVDERTMTQRLIVQSHAGSEVWGLDCHPRDHIFATGGEDRTVRIYKVSTRKPSMVRELEDGVKCVAYSPDGLLLAVGLVSGKIIILEHKKLHEVVSRHTRELPIADLKFSPDARFLATVCLDGSLDVYDAQVEYELVGSASSTPGSGLMHLDWSADSLFIQTDNTERLHQYWDATAVVEKIEGEEQLARTKWHTWTCIYGWSVRGLVPRMGEPVGLNAVARTNSGDVLAVANDFGLVRLYRFPCPYVGSKHKRYAGHSSLVSKCCFTYDDKYLITVGAADRAIFQWEHVVD